MTDEVMGRKNKKLTYQVMQCDCKMLQGMVTGAGEICVIRSGQDKGVEIAQVESENGGN